ncbi:ornithine cyclodeaminase family protein, partial [Burkholderia sp. BC1]
RLITFAETIDHHRRNPQMQALFPQVRFDASSAEAAVKAADVIVTATRSAVPLFDGADVKAGTFVAAIGSSKPNAREIDDTVLSRASLIVVESLEQAKAEAGDLLMAAAGVIHWEEVVELGSAIANGDSLGRDEGDITVFKSLGIGLADVALGELVTRRVMQKAQALA